jgi:hypothetical protein
MDFGQGIFAVIAPTAGVYVSVPVRIQGTAGTGPAEADIVHRTGIAIVAGTTRVVCVVTPSRHTSLQGTWIPIVTVLGPLATETTHLFFIDETIAVIIHTIGADLVAVRRLSNPGMDHFILIIAVRSAADMAHVSIQVFVDRIALVITESLITLVESARILIITVCRIGARDPLFEGSRRSCPVISLPFVFLFVVAGTAHHKKKA